MKGKKYLPFLLILLTILTGCLSKNTRLGNIAGTIVIREELLSSNSLLAIESNSTIPLGYKPLKNALITVKNSTQTTITNDSGSFLIRNLNEGKHTLIVNAKEVDISREFEIEVLPNTTNTTFYPVGKGYYLIIGVSRYKNLTSLYSADANAMEQFFTQTPHTVLTVRDEDANYFNIINIFEHLKKQMLPEDYLVIYFSGHGDSDLLALYNYSQFDQSDSLSDRDLKEIFLTLPTQEITLIIDACYSGSFFDNKPSTRALHNTNYVILASSSANEESYQYRDDGGLGLFTKHLLLGLINRRADYNYDYKITASEIYAYIQRALSFYTIDQTPMYHDPHRLDPVLFRY